MYVLNNMNKVTRASSTDRVVSQVLAAVPKHMLKANYFGYCFSVNQQKIEQFILDTGSTHHICNNRDMFIREMKKIRGVNLTGIGGQLPAESEGTIKILIEWANVDEGRA